MLFEKNLKTKFNQRLTDLCNPVHLCSDTQMDGIAVAILSFKCLLKYNTPLIHSGGRKNELKRVLHS